MELDKAKCKQTSILTFFENRSAVRNDTSGIIALLSKVRSKVICMPVNYVYSIWEAQVEINLHMYKIAGL